MFRCFSATVIKGYISTLSETVTRSALSRVPTKVETKKRALNLQGRRNSIIAQRIIDKAAVACNGNQCSYVKD